MRVPLGLYLVFCKLRLFYLALPRLALRLGPFFTTSTFERLTTSQLATAQEASGYTKMKVRHPPLLIAHAPRHGTEWNEMPYNIMPYLLCSACPRPCSTLHPTSRASQGVIAIFSGPESTPAFNSLEAISWPSPSLVICAALAGGSVTLGVKS